MHRMPPQEDEQPEHLTDADAEGLPSAKYSLPQRRRGVADEVRPRKYYYTDEHPEVPKVRRASLHAKVYQQPFSLRPEPVHVEQELVVEEELVEDEQESLTTPDTMDRILLAQRRRPEIYEPPPARPQTYGAGSKRPYRNPYNTAGAIERASTHDLDDRTADSASSRAVPRHATNSRQHRKQPLSLLAYVKPFRQSHNMLFLGGATLVLAVILIVVAGVAYGIAPHMLLPVGDNTGGANNVPPANPHEIVITPPQGDHAIPPVLATSAYLFDADTGATLYAQNPFMHLPMLSTTKLMTALLAAEEGNPDQNISITPAIANDISQLSADSSVMVIKQGETYSLRQLLYGMMLVSGNDAAVAIADALGGGQQNFVERMNRRAAQLNLHDTHYVNPHGLLNPGQYSSAHDLAILAKYSLSKPLIHLIDGTKEFDIAQSDQHAAHHFRNGNQFLWWYPGTDGGKPGWDAATNFVQVASCVRNQHHLIGVVMHTVDWWTDMRDLMNWGYNTYNWVSPRTVNTPDKPIPFAASWNYFSRDKKENTIPTADKGRYYIYTGYSIQGPIMGYFDKNGGLNNFGFPTTQAKAGSGTLWQQQFEHHKIQCDLKTKVCNTL